MNLIFVFLAHIDKGVKEDMLLHLYTLSYLHANQLALLIVVY